MKKLYILILVAITFISCGKKNYNDPVEVVKDFILLCEEGKMDEAEKLLTKKNDVDYFRKFKNEGKNLIFINYDYEGNDDIVELKFELLKDKSNDKVAVVKKTSNYLKQKHSFEKEIILHKVNNEWKIFRFVFLPVIVK